MQRVFDSLARKTPSKILLVVLDGLGGIPVDGSTELAAAATPNMDRQARVSALGRLVPVEEGITPGSGPAHVALFGYDPLEFQVGRGVLECLGVGLDPSPEDLCARGNFANVRGGVVTDRRARKDGERMSTGLCRELCSRLQNAIPGIGDVEVVIRSGEEHRFAVLFRGAGLGSAGLPDTDPGDVGRSALLITAGAPESEKAAGLVNEFVRRSAEELAGRDQGNYVLLRGLGSLPKWPSMQDRFQLDPVCVAAYPMYRGLARLVGMAITEVDTTWEGLLDGVRRAMKDHDFVFLHLKETDKAGEDGDFHRKVEFIERFDEELFPRLLALGFDVFCLTGDHSTPAAMASHSWHHVPVMLSSRFARPNTRADHFDEKDCIWGSLGVLYSKQLMGLLLAHGQKLVKFGA